MTTIISPPSLSHLLQSLLFLFFGGAKQSSLRLSSIFTENTEYFFNFTETIQSLPFYPNYTSISAILPTLYGVFLQNISRMITLQPPTYFHQVKYHKQSDRSTYCKFNWIFNITLHYPNMFSLHHMLKPTS